MKRRQHWLFGGIIGIAVVVAILYVMARYRSLPETRPQTFTATYRANIPQAELYEEMVIAPLGSYYQLTYQHYVSRINFTLTTEELDAVYAAFRTSSFSRIPTGQRSLAADEAGTYVSLQAGSRTYVVIETAEDLITDAWTAQWQFVRQALFAIRGREVQKQIVPFTITLDPSLIGAPLTLYLNREVLFEGEVDVNETQTPVTFTKIPGDYLVELVLGELYSYEFTLSADSSLLVALIDNQVTINGECISCATVREAP